MASTDDRSKALKRAGDEVMKQSGMYRQVLRTVLLAPLLCISAAAQSQTITGKVGGASDGDTIMVLDANNQQRMISLDGIDAPESAQDFGSHAKQSLSDLVFGKTVTVTSWKTDRYGRILGKVTLDGKNINLEQVNRGLAWFYRYYAKDLQPEDAAAYERAGKRWNRRQTRSQKSPAASAR
ncbi:MAG TPA: thermonuclease family protein [Blastocatellia bacterium]|nr:thermonuclease family protein [Blastocatellia bacterium]